MRDTRKFENRATQQQVRIASMNLHFLHLTSTLTPALASMKLGVVRCDVRVPQQTVRFMMGDSTSAWRERNKGASLTRLVNPEGSRIWKAEVIFHSLAKRVQTQFAMDVHVRFELFLGCTVFASSESSRFSTDQVHVVKLSDIHLCSWALSRRLVTEEETNNRHQCYSD